MRHERRATQGGEGSLAAESVGVAADGDEQLRGGDVSHSVQME